MLERRELQELDRSHDHKRGKSLAAPNVIPLLKPCKTLNEGERQVREKAESTKAKDLKGFQSYTAVRLIGPDGPTAGQAGLSGLPGSAKRIDPEFAPPRHRIWSNASYPDPNFARFWDAYPRRVEKRAAYRAWVKRLDDGADPEWLIQRAALFAVVCNCHGTERAYTPYPASWLNGERDEDDLEGELAPAPRPRHRETAGEFATRRFAERVERGEVR